MMIEYQGSRTYSSAQERPVFLSTGMINYWMRVKEMKGWLESQRLILETLERNPWMWFQVRDCCVELSSCSLAQVRLVKIGCLLIQKRRS